MQKTGIGSRAVLAIGVAAALGCGGGSRPSSPGPASEGPASDPCANQPSGTACTWLGVRGQAGFNGDGHPRFQTRVDQPQDIVFLPDGTAWFTDFNNYLVRKVMSDGTVRSVVGWTDPIFPGDGPQGPPDPTGTPGSDWQLNHPTALRQQPDGSVLVAAWHDHKLLTVDPKTGLVKIVCGSGAGFAGDGGPENKALFNRPNDIAYDVAGNLYVADQANLRIRKIDTSGTISTIAGTGTYGTAGDDGPALMAQFSWAPGDNPNPSGYLLYNQGKLYVADTQANRIRVIDLASGAIGAFAGTGDAGFAGDGGPARSAQLSEPRGMAIGPEGDLYVADTNNGAVRAIDIASGTIRTVVGAGVLGMDDHEQLPANQMHLRRPFGVAFDAAGNLYVMDSLNMRIVKVAK